MRPCSRDVITLRYCNQGYAPASNVVAHVKLPAYISLKSSSHPYTFNASDSTYTFDIGTLEAGHCGTITIQDSVSCTAPLGSEQCIKAWLTPGNALAPEGCVPRPPGYDGSVIEVENTGCTGTWLEPVFTIRNTGEAMGGPREYRVYLDSLLAYRHSYQLGAGDSLVITVPRTAAQAQAGVSVRVEADQDAEYPYGRIASERDHCWLTSLAPARVRSEIFPQDDESPVVDIDCQQVRGSYDPNDKSVSPKGISSSGNVAPGTPLTYTIRFQNTGSDTAYAVRIEDTLSADLDLSTLELGASSHPYEFSVSGKGRPAFRFQFDNIKLVDSITNEAESHGFVSFSIRPKAGLAIGTRIENTASIYFDFNDPVVTNTTVNTIYEPTVTPGLIDSVIVTRTRPRAANRLTVVPNPSTGVFTVSSAEPLQAEALSLQGQVLVPSFAVKGRKEIDLTGYGRGVYLLRLRTDQGVEVRKVVVE